MPLQTDNQSLGKLGEQLACEALTRQGYAIIATRHRTRFGEIDIVSEQNGVIVFVEVKARQAAPEYDDAIEAISPLKRRRVAAMALDYLAWSGQLDSPCRFDVVAIDGLGSPRETIRIVDHAWEMDY
jgi:putative endonuclease